MPDINFHYKSIFVLILSIHNPCLSKQCGTKQPDFPNLQAGDVLIISQCKLPKPSIDGNCGSIALPTSPNHPPQPTHEKIFILRLRRLLTRNPPPYDLIIYDFLTYNQ
jgi:hypothetical protein